MRIGTFLLAETNFSWQKKDLEAKAGIHFPNRDDELEMPLSCIGDTLTAGPLFAKPNNEFEAGNGSRRFPPRLWFWLHAPD
jgi:hypothetical protein